MKRFLIILALLLLPQLALAADKRCGVDTDLNGSVDHACPAPDADGDGYATDGTGRNAGRDCLDTGVYGFMIYPGISTTIGATAGFYHTCQSDGTWSAEVALASFSCNTPGGTTYFVDYAQTDCSGSGTYASPEDIRCWADPAMTGYHAPTDDDCIVAKRAGTYNHTFTEFSETRSFFIYNTASGTSGHPIHLTVQPGQTWWELGAGNGVVLQGAGTWNAPAVRHGQVETIDLELANWWKVSGFEINGTGGFENSGIHLAESTDAEIFNNYIHDINGEEDDNTACVKTRVNANRTNVHNNFLGRCYERQATTGDPDWNSPNNSELRGMDSDDVFVHENVVWSDNSSTNGIDAKHGIANAVGWRIVGNIIFDTGYPGIGVDAVPNTLIERNYLDNSGKYGYSGCLRMEDFGGGYHEHWDFIIRRNTCRNSPAPRLNPTNTMTRGSHMIATVTDNIFDDDRATSYAADMSTGFLDICFYGDETLYANINGGFSLDRNCYFNSASTTLRFSYFGSDSSGLSGADYLGLTAWKAGPMGFDANSYNENPAFGTDGIATSANCLNKGWNSGNEGAPNVISCRPFRERMRMHAR